MLLKVSIVLLVAAGAALAQENTEESCKPYVDQHCSKAPIQATKPCSPIYGAINNNKDLLRTYIKEHIGNSFEYLLQWANFNNYKKDREGFAKLYRKLSDDTWEDSIKLVKYLGKRGLDLDFADMIEKQIVYGDGQQTSVIRQRSNFSAQELPVDDANRKAETRSNMLEGFEEALGALLPFARPPAAASSREKVEEVEKKYGAPPEGATSDTEIASLAKVLDLHKHLAISGNKLHENSLKREKSSGVAQHEHDVELAHFIEEEFAEKHAQTVRDLAGHSNDLYRLLKEGGKPAKNSDSRGLYVHLFDEYLRKIY